MKLKNPCPICGKIEPFRTWYWGHIDIEHVCENKECADRAEEYEKKRDDIMKAFAKEKERLLRPWKEKLEADFFLLDQEYLKGRANV